MLGGHVATLPVDELTGSVTFSYAEIEQLTQLAGLDIGYQGGELHVSATLTIPGLNVTAPVSGRGLISVANGVLRLSVSQLAVAGFTVSDSVLAQLTSSLAVPITIPALPYGLQVRTVTPTTGGVVVAGGATNVVIGVAAGSG